MILYVPIPPCCAFQNRFSLTLRSTSDQKRSWPSPSPRAEARHPGSRRKTVEGAGRWAQLLGQRPLRWASGSLGIRLPAAGKLARNERERAVESGRPQCLHQYWPIGNSKTKISLKLFLKRVPLNFLDRISWQPNI